MGCNAMIRQDIDVNGYWKIIIVYNVYLGKKDTGFTYTDFDKKKSIIGISEVSSKEQFFNTLVHEIKHVQSHICKYYNVLEDSEDAAYLSGFIAQKAYKAVKKFI
jgi:hypothetical protein